MKSFALALALLAAAAVLPAQTGDVPRISEVIEVRLINVEFVVTGPDGRHVHGLTADDFEVYDGGRKQEITNFSEISADQQGAPPLRTAPAPAPAVDAVPRHYVVFFDCISTSTFDRHRAEPAIARVVDQLRPGDDMMIVSWNRRLRIVAMPTADRARLTAALSRASRELSLSTEPLRPIYPDLTRRGAPAPTSVADMRRAQLVGAEDEGDLKSALAALESVLQPLGGVAGRKVVIVVSSGFSGSQARANAAETFGLIPAMDAENRLAQAALVANAAGATLYTLYAKGLSVDSQYSASTHSAARDSQNVSSDLGLEYLARSTGGSAATNTNSFTTAVARLADDLSNYYSIGYRMPTARDNRERRIVVRVRNPAYTVRHRVSAVQRTVEKEVVDTVRGALLFPLDRNDLGITLKIGNPTRSHGRIIVPVDVKVPRANLTFAPDFAGLAADLSVFVASSDATGSMSEVRRFDEVVRATRSQVAALAAGTYTYPMNVMLRTATAENRIVVAVLDNLSKASGFASTSITASR